MAEPETLVTPEGRRIAVRRRPGTGPGVVFLHGLRSDMRGAKAQAVADWAAARGRAVTRFDCSGHGESAGRFEEGAIGDWAEDAAAVLAACDGPQVLVGSSMGGWLSLLLARRMPGRIAGLVGIAAAPDFTEDLMWADATADQRAALTRDGRIARPSDHGEPYVVTRRLIEDGRRHLVLRDPLDLPFPVRLLHGTADADVPPAVALRLLDHAAGPDIRLTLVKGADHRFSTPDCLALVADTLEDVLRRCRNP